VAIEVTDTGIGIPVEEQARVFDLFHVLGSLMNHSSAKLSFRGGGMGLGLPIARGIVVAHNGKLSVSSPGYDPEACPGTTFQIFLPLPDAS
jgi:signal transduction histidine kinase